MKFRYDWSAGATALLLVSCSAGNTPHTLPEHPTETVDIANEATSDHLELSEVPITSGALGGLYIDAGEDTPVILIVPGSGPTDLNGNNPLGVRAQPLKLLAESLSANNISTVRVDKRGMYSSRGAGDPNQVSVDLYTEDYRGWIDVVKSRTGAKCIYLMGHSEGSIMVSAAAEGRRDICGLILVSGPGRPLGTVLRAQLEANPANAPILDQAFGAIASLEAGEVVETSSLHPGLKGLFAEPIQGYLMSVLTVDPAVSAQRANQRTLVIQGETDVQTSVEDAQLLAHATGTAAAILPGVNHVLKVATTEETQTSYANPDLPIAESVVEAIVSFIRDGN